MKRLHSTGNALIVVTLLLFIVALLSCTDAKKTKSSIKTIRSTRQLDKITSRAKDRLLMIDFMDEGCMSCFFLSTMLEEIAKEQKDKVTIYTIAVARNPEIAKTFNVARRPYVVYVKNQKVVHAFTGLQPKETIVEAIDRFVR